MKTLASLSRNGGVILLALLKGALLTGLTHSPVAAAEATFARYPSSSGSQIAFVARGDLWTAPRDGGSARRVVRSPGHVLAACFSPDGRWIAYTERRAGGQDVFVVRAEGGAPRRLTFDARAPAQDNFVVGWTPDSRHVVFLSDRGAWAHKILRAFAAPLEGGAAESLPLTEAGLLSFAPDGSAIAYNRTFTALDARKRYTGGEATDVWIYDLRARQARRVTNWKGSDSAPLWWRRRIYFLSNRGVNFRQNLWCYDLDSGAARQITRFSDFDIDTAALGGDRVTFDQGGRLWALELPSERLHALEVAVPDDGRRTAASVADVSGELRDTDVSGAADVRLTSRGDTVLVSSHGELFRHALPTGVATNLTNTPGVQEEHPSPSPDGRWIAYVTEADGGQQIALRPAGGGAERRLARAMHGVLYTPTWSPGGERLVVADAEHGLWLIDPATGASTLVHRDPVAEIRDASFSPDARWLAYSTTRTTGQQALHLYEFGSGRDVVVSDPLESDRSPVFGEDGRTLYFVSQRHEAPFTSDRGDETTISLLKSDGLYAAALAPSPFPPPGPMRVEPTGLMARATALPVAPARIVSLEARGGRLFYETRPPALIGGELAGETAALHAYDPVTRQDRVVVSDLDLHALSGDGRRVLFERDGAWRLASTDAGAGTGETEASLTGLSARIEPRAEWAQMFERAWRLDRDLFFSRAMNGDDWGAVHDAYAPWVARLGSHDDFVYLLRELQGELATSHAFIGGPDPDDTEPRLRTPRLGLDLARDLASDRYRIAHIYQGDPTRERFRSPLASQDVRAGDLLLAIDGRPLRAPLDPDSLLAGRAGELSLTVAAGPDAPERTLKISPLRDDVDLRQHDWVEANRRRVDTLSGGRIGYIFMADFEARGSEDFARQFQGQLDKSALILDIRWNEGGFTSQAVLDVLRRARAGAFVNREGAAAPLPLFGPPRTLALITNAHTASDGDQFAYYFRALGLGKIVGERTWGGVQGIRGPWPLMDGTFITIPKDSLASPDGRWLIENVGVAPDLVVTADPNAAAGVDRQLEATVSLVLKTLAARPAPPPHVPAPLPAYPAGGQAPPATFGRGAR